MTLNRLLTGALVAQLIILGALIIVPAQTRTQPASASQATAFDHSTCQYPDRWSNPVDGCDNSDPAAPECIKEFSTRAGEQACIAALKSERETPNAKPHKIITVPETVKPYESWGK